MLKKRAHAWEKGLEYRTHELKGHTAVQVGATTKTLGRHNEVDDVTVRTFFDQFADELGGKGWWR